MEVEEALHMVDLKGFQEGSEHFGVSARLCPKAALQTKSSQHGLDNLVTTNNIALLRAASGFLEVSDHYEASNLHDFLATMPFWSLSQCMSLLKSLDVAPCRVDNASIMQQCVSLISSKASSLSNTSTPTCFSPNSGNSSSESNASGSYSYACLYEDITHLSVALLEKLIMAMISHHVDNKFLAKSLLHYLQTAKKRAMCNYGLNAWNATEAVPLDMFESIVALLYKLERASVSCGSLFGLQRMATKLHASKACRKKIEEMIGSELDKATLDNILVSRHRRDGMLYDVNLIIRLVKIFLRKQADAHSVIEIGPVKRVGNLLDKYLAEIAPDPRLIGAKFKAVADSLPDFAKDSHDDLYRALDIYLEAHPSIQEDEAIELCKMINFSKLSMETSRHAAQSLRVPARITLQLLLQEQASLKAAMGHHPHQNLPKTRGGLSATLCATTSSLSVLKFKRQSSNVVYKDSQHDDAQYEENTIKTHRSHVRHTQNLHNQQDNSVINSLSSSPSTIACDSARSKSSFAWDGSLHSQSNGSSRRSLYEHMALDCSVAGEEQEQEQQEFEYQRVLRQNEELRTDLQLMHSRVLELEKACGQMRSKVSKYMKTRPLLC